MVDFAAHFTIHAIKTNTTLYLESVLATVSVVPAISI